MPEELRDLMGRAVEGPVSPVDAEEVWSRGSRERRMRRVAQIAPVVVIVGLVVGLVVVASSDDDAAPIYADLTEEDQIAAHRELNAAVNDVVGAITTEGQVSLGWTAEVASDEDLVAAQAATDLAVDGYRQVTDELPADLLESDPSIGEAFEVAEIRIQALPTVRDAVAQGIHPTYTAVADSFAVTAADLLEVDRVVASQLPSAPAYLQSATVQAYVWLLPTALRSAAAVYDLLERTENGIGVVDLRRSLDAEAELHTDFLDTATADQKIIERSAGPGQASYAELTNLVADREPESSSGQPAPTLGEAFEVIRTMQVERVEVARRLIADLDGAEP